LVTHICRHLHGTLYHEDVAKLNNQPAETVSDLLHRLNARHEVLRGRNQHWQGGDKRVAAVQYKKENERLDTDNNRLRLMRGKAHEAWQGKARQANQLQQRVVQLEREISQLEAAQVVAAVANDQPPAAYLEMLANLPKEDRYCTYCGVKGSHTEYYCTARKRDLGDRGHGAGGYAGGGGGRFAGRGGGGRGGRFAGRGGARFGRFGGRGAGRADAGGRGRGRFSGRKRPREEEPQE
jgi:hypothetical protein